MDRFATDPAVARPCRAVVAAVDDGSPAARAGIKEGDVITAVEGVPLRDMIEWRWQSDGPSIEVEFESGETAVIERDFGEGWGIAFSDSIFDGMMMCRNACTFCFMGMLPPDMRKTLYLRDDDYRLSFLQGNFVTLTNIDDDELDRIIEMRISPLHVSLHAVTPEARRRLMGKNAERGMEVLEEILEAGLEVHAQVVVVPGENDGEELEKTLEWIDSHPQVLSAGFVPLGYTRYQDRFDHSFSDAPDEARAVVDLIERFQVDPATGSLDPKYQIADEFYMNAGYDFPCAEAYAGYPQFQDGIGMMRSFIDEWESNRDAVEQAAEDLGGEPVAHIACGKAFSKVLAPLIEGSALAGKLEVLAVECRFFGGNVDVTGLITGQDLMKAIKEAKPEGKLVLSSSMLNADGVFLDGVSLSQAEQESGADICLCTYSPSQILESLMR